MTGLNEPRAVVNTCVACGRYGTYDRLFTIPLLKPASRRESVSDLSSAST
ncbi:MULTISPECIES: hypothetical protein [Bacteroides]|uniref:Uncharacterized protein n=1 Tax=Bacteroides intestinalis DSM 17393 TaxID=471870 RepID=B3CDC6_9BACE|nr:hypothetical protein [Bacteroides intestinalis]EDV03187.1 hypothetical protein BACINT_02301 [Bacteroides intestinalis DSM 17393]MBS5495093.1 hypothetical protein [Bacteroides intestinalis]